jgi:type III secretion system YscQ/HrcQ family protein
MAMAAGDKMVGWRPYRFQNLEKVSRSQALLTQRLEWLIPSASGHVVDGIRARLKELFEDEVTLALDYVHVVRTAHLKKMIGVPTFLAVLAPAPQKPRGFLEIELGLAHAAIDKLLGGAGDVGHRPLTDIEEGVMSFIILEALKTLAPNLDPGLPRMRLEGVVHTVDDALVLSGEETQLIVVQLKGTLGDQQGFVRLFIPATVVGMTSTPEKGPERRARRLTEFTRNAHRLAAVKVWLRAEIGKAEILGRELARLHTGDVVLLDEITARPDQGAGGTASLRIGRGKAARAAAQIVVDAKGLKAKITAFQPGEEPQPSPEPAQDPGAGAPEAEAEELNPTDDVTDPGRALYKEGHVSQNTEGADLLNDIPLQVAVELGRVPMAAEDIVALKVGQVIDLARMPGEPVDMSVNGKVVARGELVEIEGHLGVRILSLLG